MGTLGGTIGTLGGTIGTLGGTGGGVLPGSRENNSFRAWSSRENSSYERSRLSIQASSSWAVGRDHEGQIVVRCEDDRETHTLAQEQGSGRPERSRRWRREPRRRRG